MGQSRRLTAIGVLVTIGALALTFAAVASARHVKHIKYRHVLITFSGSGGGTYTASNPEGDSSPGVCYQAANSVKTVDNFTFSEQFKLTFPDGAGNPEGRAVKAGGTDISSDANPACTNGFGNQAGGDSYYCTTPFIKAYQSQGEAPYPMGELFGAGRHLTVDVTGGVQSGPNPVGTNCVGAPLGMSVDSFVDTLNGKLHFSTAALKKHGSLSVKVHASKNLSCGSTTCDENTCINDQAGPSPVPDTCSTAQDYTGDLKIKLVK